MVAGRAVLALALGLAVLAELPRRAGGVAVDAAPAGGAQAAPGGRLAAGTMRTGNRVIPNSKKIGRDLCGFCFPKSGGGSGGVRRVTEVGWKVT